MNRLILRAALSTTFAIALWWFLLKGPSLLLLRLLAYLPLAVLIAPTDHAAVIVDPRSGEWVFNVSVGQVVQESQTGRRQYVESIEFMAAPDNVAFFAVGWFTYLALAFSAGAFNGAERHRLFRGLAAQTAINIMALSAYVYINGHGSVTGAAGLSAWLMRYCYHLIYLVVPFAAPFAVAIAVHPGWIAYFRPAAAGAWNPNNRGIQ